MKEFDFDCNFLKSFGFTIKIKKSARTIKPNGL
jgi:hypothetical protein